MIRGEDSRNQIYRMQNSIGEVVSYKVFEAV